jgi:hypothetical protein
MPRIIWPLLHDRPIVEVVLSPVLGSPPLVRTLMADTGAGTARSRFELLMPESDCLLCGGFSMYSADQVGAYAGSVPVYLVRIRIPALGFDRSVRVAGVSACPAGYDGIAGFRFLNQFNYGNFGDPNGFGLEM